MNSKRLTYPTTKMDSTSHSYFKTVVKDPYHWLENDQSPETAEWVKKQNNVTHGFLEKITTREAIGNRLTKLWDYEITSVPFKEGKYTYFYKNDGLQNQSVLYRFQDSIANSELFLDPNTFSKNGTIALGQVSFSESGKLVAYSISEGGSDWKKVIVMDTETKNTIGDTLTDIKFSNLAWKNDEGFFYSSYDKPDGSELSAKTEQHKLYYHTIGTLQAKDKLIFGGKSNEKRRYVGGATSEDYRFLFINAAETTSGNELYLVDLRKKDLEIIPILSDFKSDSRVVHTKGTSLYIETNRNAPNKKLIRVDASNPRPENWEVLLPEKEHVLSTSCGGDAIFASYMVDALSQVKHFDLDGNLIRDIQLPDLGSANGFEGKKDDTTVYYRFSNYLNSSSYAYDIKTGISQLYLASKCSFKSEEYESKQVFYTSKDGTKVPMVISHKKGVVLNGKNPTILYGYGGFNVSLTPAFSPGIAAWLELGGVYAVANLRGGGEYGKKWHLGGTKMNKQNVFDDFIAAAEYLKKENYATKEYLAIRGGSNGGLLVGAVLTQRPDIMKVAIPQVGVLDMLRYHTFTSGAGWAYDYGTAEESPEMFAYLKNYSPVHNVKKGVDYPATLITTGDHDDRVVPAHSYKFAAELQAKNNGVTPALIRIETDAGHGAGKPISKTIEEYTDILGFILYNMGIQTVPYQNATI